MTTQSAAQPGTDYNYRSFADATDVTIADSTVFDPQQSGDDRLGYDDILKFSNAKRIRGSGIVASGGRENPLDMNRTCEDIVLDRVRLAGGNQCAIVIKGGSRGIRLSNVIIADVPRRWYDIELGGWSDQSFAKTTGTVLDEVYREDGKPVRVVVGRADWPEVIGGHVRICYVRSYVLKAFWWFKRFARALG